MSSYRPLYQILISSLLNEQPSDAFSTVKLRRLIACISRTKHDPGLGASAIVFYELTLSYELHFSIFLGERVDRDSSLVVAREKLMTLTPWLFDITALDQTIPRATFRMARSWRTILGISVKGYLMDFEWFLLLLHHRSQKILRKYISK